MIPVLYLTLLVMLSGLALAWATVRCSGKRWVEVLLWGTAIAALLFLLGWPLWKQEVPKEHLQLLPPQKKLRPFFLSG